MTAIDGAHFTELIADLEGSIGKLLASIEPDSAQWPRGLPGKWSVGQQCEHVAICLDVPVPLFRDAARHLAAGTLPRKPGRGPLQSIFVAFVVKRGAIPRGGPAARATFPAVSPQLPAVAARLRAATDVYRSLAAGIDPGALDRLWIRNPFMTKFKWHYSLPEMVRMQAVHVRHHCTQMAEIARS